MQTRLEFKVGKKREECKNLTVAVDPGRDKIFERIREESESGEGERWKKKR